MLLGRGPEVGRIETLLRRALRERTSAALIIHGEPGVGKTTLLEHIVSEHAAGLTVLRAHPLESESELAFAGLFDLVRPVEPLLERLPGPQRAALASALAIGPPAPSDRFAVAAAMLSLLAAAANDGPVLAVVDDAQWLDAASREALLFAGRRLANEGVVLLLGTRDGDWLAGAGVATLALRGLEPDDAAALVERTDAGVALEVQQRLIGETRGNPLALLEALRNLSDSELRGATPIVGPVVIGAALEHSFARDLELLPPDTQRALLLVAASDTAASSEITAALEATGLARSVLEPAERAGLIKVSERVEFRHPLIRSAAYHRNDPVARREAHRALANAVGAGARSAWHLAAATAGPDEGIAAQLETAGAAAMARSGYAAAARAFETAARLSVEDSDRLRRVTDAGRALWLAGQPRRAAMVLEEGLELATDPILHADLQQLRSTAMLFTVPLSETFGVLLAEARQMVGIDARRAATLFAGAALACFPTGDVGRAQECAREAVRVAPAEHETATFARLVLGVIVALGGQSAEARALLVPHVEQLRRVNPLEAPAFVAAAVAQALVWLEHWADAAAILNHLVASARAAGSPTMLNLPLASLAEFELRRGRVAAAYAAATEAVDMAAATGQTVEAAQTHFSLARVEAVLGLADSCRANVAAAQRFADSTGAHSIHMYAAATLGLLELGHARPELAAAHLTDCARLEREQGVGAPTVALAAADLIEAHARNGAREEAAAALADLEEKARATGLRWAFAGAARGRGLLADEVFEPEFGAALELYGSEMPFERARTQLCLGMRLRRDRRRAGARAALTEALEYFEGAGAEPWAEQVRAELRAMGAMTAPSADGSLRALTPQELQVAMTVAKGSTNREAAASLFLSEKTVEFHLGNTYRKLGVRSRSELVRRVEGLS